MDSSLDNKFESWSGDHNINDNDDEQIKLNADMTLATDYAAIAAWLISVPVWAARLQ